jgi:V8-like Glu-specific endopeptidase
LRFPILALCLLFSCSYVVRPTTEALEIAATVRLVSRDGSCSGVAISPHNILTAAHCYSETPMRVYDYSGDYRCTGTSVKVDAKVDLMLLHTTCELPVSASIGMQEPLMGTPIIVTGYPLGVSVVVMTDGRVGTISKKEGLSLGQQVFSAPIQPGSSGGPIWANGRVVGIVSCGMQYHHTSYAVRQSTIQGFLNGK